MAIKKENYIYKVDRDNYFEQYAWALENYDLKVAFEDFIKCDYNEETDGNKTEKSDKEIEEQWQKFKYNNKEGIITNDMIGFLNYVMKYENGVYKKDDEIAVLYEGRGNIQIQEPGYYMIELKGASGLNKIECKNFLMTGDNKIVKYLDESKENVLWIDPHLNFISILKNNDKYDITRGYIEFNKNFIFLFKFENKENENDSSKRPNRQISPTERTNIEENIEEQFFKREDFDGNTTFYDFAKFNTDPFSKEFFTLKFILNNNATFYNDDMRYVYNNLQGFLCGADEEKANEILSKLNDSLKGDYYYDIINKNLEKPTGKLFTYNDVLNKSMDKTNAPFKDFNMNYMHGGDGGYVKAIVKFDEPINFQYNIGKANSKDNTATYLISNKETYYAEKGGNVFSKDSDIFEFFNQFSDNSINLDDLPQVKDKFVFEDQACKNFRNKTNFHVGEQFGYNDYKAGCGRGIVCRTNKDNKKETSVFYGGGQLGSGLRLNEFENAYYQVPEDGFIKITYLSSKYAQKFPLNIETTGADNLFYIEDKVPISGKIKLKISTNSLFGGMENDDNLKKDKLVDTERNINYLSFNLDTKKFKNGESANIKLNYDQNLRYIKYNNSDKAKFIGFDKTNNKNEELNTSDYFNALFPRPEYSIDQPDTYLNFSMSGSLSFINYLLFAYNSANTDDDGNENGADKEGGLRININEFNFTTNHLELNLRNFNNFNFINAFDEIIQLSFNYKNTILLNSYYDIFSQEVLEDCEGKIIGLEYSIVDPDVGSDSFISYTEGTKFIVPKYTKLYIKVFFNTSRVLLNEDECNLFGINNFYKKNVNFNKKIVLDQYFGGKENGVNFQCFEFIPNATQDISLFIKRNTYKLNIYNDLFNNLNVRNLSNKLDFEVGEACILSFDLKNYERISHLANRKHHNYDEYGEIKFNGTKEVSNYFIFDSNHKFESFIEFWDDKTNYEYNINDINIQDLLDRKNCNNVGIGFEETEKIEKLNSEKGIICQTTRKYISYLYEKTRAITENELRNIVYINDENTIDNENCIIYIYFKDCNINVRLSSDYSPNQKLCAVEKNNVTNIDIFKNYNFVVYGVGGPTGNGESGGDTAPNSSSEVCLGGCGGDGFVGGNGGNGGNTAGWGVYKEGWQFLFTNIGVFMCYSGGGGLGGRGFKENGSQGTSGTCAFGKQPVYYIKVDDNLPKEYTHTIKSPYYVGIPFIGEVSFFSNIDAFKKINVKITAGEQGLSFEKALTGEHGRGGGQGLASYINILNSSENDRNGCFMKLTDKYHIPTKNFNANIVNSELNNYYKNIFFEGGRPGLCRGVYTSLGAYALSLWSIKNIATINKTESFVPGGNNDRGLVENCYKEYCKVYGIGYKNSGKICLNPIATNVGANEFLGTNKNFDSEEEARQFLLNCYSACGFLTFNEEEVNNIDTSINSNSDVETNKQFASSENPYKETVSYCTEFKGHDIPQPTIDTYFTAKLKTGDRQEKNISKETKDLIKKMLNEDLKSTLYVSNCNENYNYTLDSILAENDKVEKINKSSFQGNLYNSTETGIVKLVTANLYNIKDYNEKCGAKNTKRVKIEKPNDDDDNNSDRFDYKYLIIGGAEYCELNEFNPSYKNIGDD